MCFSQSVEFSQYIEVSRNHYSKIVSVHGTTSIWGLLKLLAVKTGPSFHWDCKWKQLWRKGQGSPRELYCCIYTLKEAQQLLSFLGAISVWRHILYSCPIALWLNLLGILVCATQNVSFFIYSETCIKWPLNFVVFQGRWSFIAGRIHMIL